MSEDSWRCHAPGQVRSVAKTAVRFVSAEKLRTSYAPLRPAALRPHTELSAALPLRVAHCAHDAESNEVVDGFKRLAQRRERGCALVPVVLECACAVPEHKRLLLAANAPARTTTALDEARVVCSLMQENAACFVPRPRGRGHGGRRTRSGVSCRCEGPSRLVLGGVRDDPAADW